jgi:hypothetical protein
MAKKRSSKKQSSFKGFYKSNGNQTKERALYDAQLVGANPEGKALNSGY